ncbi:C40 family peptidase [Brevibacillus sp. 179-C9.3 HS]|uniref:C40 family peptidase n=1 Tax=unclassified Brevibacillus TaxID=2684853 RepID=UPI0039A159F4
MTKRNWKGRTNTVVAILMGTSLLMSGQAYAASENTYTSTDTYSLDQNNEQAENDQADQVIREEVQVDQTTDQVTTPESIPNKQNDSDDSSSAIADQVISKGMKYEGVPYKYGSSKKTTRTFDCSSFTQRVFKEVGIKLPRDSRQQSKVGQSVSKDQLQKGDLVFFRSYGSSSDRITHVAIYAGDNTLLHTYGKPGVTTTKFEGTSWEKRFEKAKRVI